MQSTSIKLKYYVTCFQRASKCFSAMRPGMRRVSFARLRRETFRRLQDTPARWYKTPEALSRSEGKACWVPPSRRHRDRGEGTEMNKQWLLARTPPGGLPTDE